MRGHAPASLGAVAPSYTKSSESYKPIDKSAYEPKPASPVTSPAPAGGEYELALQQALAREQARVEASAGKVEIPSWAFYLGIGLLASGVVYAIFKPRSGE